MEITDVKYIGPGDLSAVDMQPFIEAPEQVPRQVEIADLEQVLESAVKKLFEEEKTSSYASFIPPPNYSLKNLFKRKMLPGLDIDKMISALDEYVEVNAEAIDEEEANTLTAMGYTILDKSCILTEIRDRMLSIVKS
jgi:hypothetical protein